MASASKLLLLRRLSASRSYSSVCGSRLCFPISHVLEPSKSSNLYVNNLLMGFRNFWSRPLNLDKETQGPAAIDYRYVVNLFQIISSWLSSESCFPFGCCGIRETDETLLTLLILLFWFFGFQRGQMKSSAHGKLSGDLCFLRPSSLGPRKELTF